MLHEILLGLSGHPTPLLPSPSSPHPQPPPPPQPLSSSSSTAAAPAPSALSALTPPERDLLDPLARLADLHARLDSRASRAAARHRSAVCRAVAAAVRSGPLAQFRRHVLDVEDRVLRRDAGMVADGGSEAVPLTAIVAEFTPWLRRMEWLWTTVVAGFLTVDGGGGGSSGSGSGSKGGTAAKLIQLLRAETVSGYADVEEEAGRLAGAAEGAWLRQVAAWVLYGRLPASGSDGDLADDDFFVRRVRVEDDSGGEQEDDFACEPSLLPPFVTAETAGSMLFIGKSLAHIRLDPALAASSSFASRATDVAEQLLALSRLSLPLDPSAFSRAIAYIRLSLSRNTLQRLLPLARVLDVLGLLRDFFLLGRGEFAAALIREADQKMWTRWKGRTDAYERRQRGNSAAAAAAAAAGVALKEGEAAAVLSGTWSVLAALQGRHAAEDEGLELARELVRLSLTPSGPPATLLLPPPPGAGGGDASPLGLAATPFRNLLLATPASLTMRIPPPLDMFLTPADLAVYSAISAYLLAIRRAHIRLTDLWKVTPLRRHHPAPPGPPAGSSRAGRPRVVLLRKRATERAEQMRGPWVTCSAAVLFLAETEAYLQGDVVATLWEAFHLWLTDDAPALAGERDDDDVWLSPSLSPPSSRSSPSPRPPRSPRSPSAEPRRRHGAAAAPRDPQTLAAAHRAYLVRLCRRLLLTRSSFTDPLYELLARIDHLVALVHRLQAIWAAADLEDDVGVVDAFVDLHRERADTLRELDGAQARVRESVAEVVASLRALAATEWEDDDDEGAGGEGGAGSRFVPPRTGGGVERLLMKLEEPANHRRPVPVF